MTVYFVRHGSTMGMLAAAEDVVDTESSDTLSSEGHEESRRLGAYFRQHAPTARIISSPMQRAMQTAHAIAEAISAPINVDARLRERDFRFPGNVTVQESQTLQLQAILEPTERILGAESVAEHYDRVQSFLNDYGNSFVSAQPTLLVCHGGTIELSHAVLVDAPLSALKSHHLRLDPGRFHQWEVRYWGDRLVWRLDGVNVSA